MECQFSSAQIFIPWFDDNLGGVLNYQALSDNQILSYLIWMKTSDTRKR